MIALESHYYDTCCRFWAGSWLELQNEWSRNPSDNQFCCLKLCQDQTISKASNVIKLIYHPTISDSMTRTCTPVRLLSTKSFLSFVLTSEQSWQPAAGSVHFWPHLCWQTEHLLIFSLPVSYYPITGRVEWSLFLPDLRLQCRVVSHSTLLTFSYPALRRPVVLWRPHAFGQSACKLQCPADLSSFIFDYWVYWTDQLHVDRLLT